MAINECLVSHGVHKVYKRESVNSGLNPRASKPYFAGFTALCENKASENLSDGKIKNFFGVLCYAGKDRERMTSSSSSAERSL